MDFSALIISEDESYNYRELEEALLSIDFEVDFFAELNPNLSWISNLEFKYDVFFLLKEPSEHEIPAVSSLSKIKVMLIKPDAYSLHWKSRKSKHWLNAKGVRLDEILEVVDERSNLSDPTKIILSASSMKAREYFEGVESIAAFNAYHISANGWKTVLNGNSTTQALVGELVMRSGREVNLAARNDNLMVFSCDIFSNEAMKAGDNARFIQNTIEVMLEGADIVE
jgi:predicted DNA-binding protein (MmcQ/YjbR family)